MKGKSEIMTRFRSKKRSTWIDITCISMIVFLSMTLVFLGYSKESDAQQNSNNGHAIEINKNVSKSKSAFPGILITTEVSNDKFAPFAIQYPQSNVQSFNDTVKKYIDDQRDAYIIAMRENKRLGNTIPGELNIAFETFPHVSGSYSFVMITGTYLGGANGYTSFNTVHFHPGSGEIIEIADLFGHDESKLNKLAALTRDAIHEDPSLRDRILEDVMMVATEPKWNNYKKFAITDDSLVLYFDEYEIASGDAGAPVIAVPLAELSEHLVAPYKLDIAEELLPKPSDEKEIEVEENASIQTENQDESVNTEMKQVALTFDDGPDPKVTPQILATLAKYDAKATFFMLGSRVEFYPDIAKEILNAGHELGNHTWTHANLTNMSTEAIKNEVSRTSDIIEQATGQLPSVFRPPYGASNDNLLNILDLPVVLWNLDTLDWKYRDRAQLLSSVKSNVHDGSTILMHDIHLSTAQGLDSVLAFLKNEGYEFVTVSELND